MAEFKKGGEALAWKESGRLLDRRDALGSVRATRQDIAVGVGGAALPIGSPESFGDAPENVDVAAGPQARRRRGDLHHHPILLGVGSIDEAFARIGERETVEEVLGRSPAGLVG